MKQKLVENFSGSWQEPLSIKRLPIQESNSSILVEGVEKKVLEKWEVPVWRLDKKNLNGRTYRESLGKRMEKVYREAVTANLADHPENDGSVNNILSVSKNPHIREGIMWVDAYIVDETFENKLKKMVEAGYGLGVSSSVLGDVDSNGFVIDESVELDRFFDWVLSPSYSVFVTEDCLINESVEKNNNNKVTINNNIEEQNNMPNEKMLKLSEHTMRLNLNKIIEDALSQEKISDRLEALNEALTYVSEDFLPDLKKIIEEKIEETKKQSFELAEKGKDFDKLNNDIQLKESEKVSLQEKISILENINKELEEKYKVSCSLLDESKEYVNKMEIMLESSDADVGSMFSALDYLKVVEQLEKSKNNESTLKEKIVELKSSIINYKNKNESLVLKVNSLKEKNASLQEAINDYEKEIEDGLINEQEPNINYDSDEFDYDTFRDEQDNDDELELDINNNSEVEDYYNDLYDSDSRYEAIKPEILKCKTLIEAQKTALRLKSLVEKQDAPIKRKYKKSFTKKEVDVGDLLGKGQL